MNTPNSVAQLLGTASILVVVSLLQACGQGANRSPEQKSPFTLQEAIGILTTKPAVNECEFLKLHAEFPKHVFTGSAQSNSPMSRPTFMFTEKSYQNQLGGKQCGGTGTAALLVRYGLIGDNLTYGISAVCITDGPNGPQFKMPANDQYFVPDTNLNLVKYKGDWVKDVGNKYTSTNPPNVFIKRTSKLTPYDSAKDIRYALHSMARVKDFITHNINTADNRSIKYIEVASWAEEKGGGNKDVQHGHCLVARDHKDQLMLEDPVVAGKEFHLKAVDLGSPCPDNCQSFIMRTTGNPVPGC